MLHVAAFAMSNYTATAGRLGKPFNPLLHETFEFFRPRATPPAACAAPVVLSRTLIVGHRVELKEFPVTMIAP